ncbi:hypothetical protein [Asticcacaulis solisilvae]|uniref:hypothetical protein n=1 Tax=Asticcacaulis solisilvae TaxID=1217274 RepID=UPI003FD8CCC6
MTLNPHNIPFHRGYLKIAVAVAALGLTTFAVPAFADQTAASAAISRADAKIEMVTAQAGQAGDNGDQSFNMARQRLTDAHTALNSGRYDTAEMLADEAALLATLTGEKAVLAALQTSHDNLMAATGPSEPNQ